MRFTTRVDGVERTIGNIDNWDKETQLKAKKVIRKTSNSIAKDGRKLAPHKTKRLRKSIRTKYYFKGMHAVIGANQRLAPHSSFFVNGTQERYKKNGSSTGKVNAIRYMQQARERNDGKFEDVMREIFMKDVDV